MRFAIHRGLATAIDQQVRRVDPIGKCPSPCPIVQVAAADHATHVIAFVEGPKAWMAQVPATLPFTRWMTRMRP